MAHDLIIRGGTVLDGTGAEGVVADVAVDGDRITAVGELADATAERVIDAAGKVVTPGFIDLHTHLDAQIGWDPMLTSSSWHGVTTVLMGNCGVTFAPVSPANRAYLAEMMESVEDIPADAILGGLPWSWSTYGEYLDAVQEMRPALNVVGLMGQCATRYHVMGERSLTDEAPTEAETAQMADLARQAIADGAVGFSTSRILLHKVPDGRHVPGTHAPIEEYVAIGQAMAEAGGGLFQGVFDMTKAAHEYQLMDAVADTGCDVLFSGGVGDAPPEVVERAGRRFAAQAEAGRRVSAICQTRPGGVLVGLRQMMPVFSPAWGRLASLPTTEARVGAMSDAATRAELIEEGRAVGTWYDAAHIHPLGLGERPDYSVDDASRRSVADLAEEAGLHPVELMVERLLESHGRELYNVWFFNRRTDSLADYLALDQVVPGLGDAGAHVGQICDADATTFALSYWARDRGQFTLPEMVRKLTSQSAGILGLRERGRIEPGWYADLNVFDHQRLASRYPDYVYDFPGGKGRFIVRSDGYAATVVNGAVVVEEGEHTGARPGTVLREFDRG
ncbi:MAG: amidohydrolase family protein [Acidimicrobiia bacterium]|nr:amidohydrolase family protein [Acidimicrobiia bacterium]MDH5237355.1 amidohydrolase family protein [Acidimicrobiia bacterium]